MGGGVRGLEGGCLQTVEHSAVNGTAQQVDVYTNDAPNVRESNATEMLHKFVGVALFFVFFNSRTVHAGRMRVCTRRPHLAVPT